MDGRHVAYVPSEGGTGAVLYIASLAMHSDWRTMNVATASK